MEATWNFHRLHAIERAFAQEGPPLEFVVATALGWTPPAKPAEQPDFEQFMQALAPGGAG